MRSPQHKGGQLLSCPGPTPTKDRRNPSAAIGNQRTCRRSNTDAGATVRAAAKQLSHIKQLLPVVSHQLVSPTHATQPVVSAPAQTAIPLARAISAAAALS